MLALALLAASAAPGAAQPGGTLAVMIASSNDTSPGVLDAHARTEHCAIVRRALREVLRRAGAEVRLSGGGARRLDVAVVAWHVTWLATGLSSRQPSMSVCMTTCSLHPSPPRQLPEFFFLISFSHPTHSYTRIYIL